MPSGNRHTEAARRYHEATTHSRQSVRSGRGLDWDIKPEPPRTARSMGRMSPSVKGSRRYRPPAAFANSRRLSL